MQLISYFQTNEGKLWPATHYQPNCWINVQQPTTTEITQLQQHFNLPQDYLTAVLDDKENPRTEGIEQSVLEKPALILLRFPQESVSPLGYSEYTTYPFAIILTQGAVITISNRPALFMRDFLLTPQSVNTANHERLALKLIWAIDRSFLNCLEQNNRAMNHLEKTLAQATENDDLFHLTAMQKSLIRFQGALHKNQQLITHLQTSEFYFETTPFKALLTDILVESEQADTMTKQQKQVIDEYNTTVSAIVSNNLNEVMKVLTLITIVLTIPTIVAGLYGMNVHLPGASHVHAFSFIIFGILIGSWLATLWLQRRHFF